MRYDLYDDDNQWVESSGACKVCGQPTQSTTGVCWYRQPSLLQRLGIWLFNLKDYFILVQRHAK